MNFILALLIGSLFGPTAQAYLLEYDTIMSRTAKNHGSGGYEIQQEIQWFPAEGAPFQIVETWTVAGENKMKLRIDGIGRLRGKVSGEIIYDGQKKTFKNEAGQMMAARIPPTFDPVFFHNRYSRSIKDRMIALKMTDARSLQGRPPMKVTDNPTYVKQDFVDLKRVGGVITYGIGTPQKSSLYIEQDQFVVTQIEFPSGPAVLAQDYKSYPLDFYYPDLLTYSWANNKVIAKTRKVVSLGRNPKPEAFQMSKDARPLLLPEEQALKEFYSVYR